ncbi:MAG: Hsp20/alpha crystallin family protein, partial [Bacteroidota bacterium]
NVLSVSAENKEESKEDTFKMREFNYHSFSRSFRLPKEIEGEKIIASHENGVLSIEIPKREKAEEEKKKSITIS